MTIQRIDFLEKIKVLNSISLSKTLIEEFKCVLFDNDYLLSTNGSVIIKIPFKTDIKGLFYLDKLTAFLNKITSDNIALFKKDNLLVVESKNSKIELIELVSEREIIYNTIDNDKWELLPTNFNDILEKSLYSTDELLNYGQNAFVNHVNIIGDKVFSTNNRKLSMYKIQDFNFNNKFSFHSKMARLILSIANVEQYSIIDDKIQFKTSCNTIIQFPISKPFIPDFDKFLEKSDDYIKIDFIHYLENAIDICNIFNSDIDDSDKRISIKIENNKIICYVNAAIGRIEYKIDLDSKIPPLEFCINPSLFLDLLKDKSFKSGISLESKRIFFENDNYIFVTKLVG